MIWRTWLPLALNWLLMALEGPIVVALIARLPSPTENLAAFSIAFSIALMVEAPVMMLLSTSAALTTDRLSYEQLWRFTSALALPLSGLMGAMGTPLVFSYINELVWQLPEAMAEEVAGAVRLLIPWPAAIAYRRLWQGILIRFGQAQLVAAGTVLRLCGMAGGALIALSLCSWEGEWIGAFALSTGVCTEMLAVRWWAAPTLKKLPTYPYPPISQRKILSFYLPLLLTSILSVGLTPLLTTFIAHGREPIPSLAAYSPTTSTVFLFSCFGVAYQEVVIVLAGTRVGQKLLDFAHRIALFTISSMSLLTLPQVYRWWFGYLFSLPYPLQSLAREALWWALPMPAVIAYLSYLKGTFIWARHTRLNLLAALTELVMVAVFASLFLFLARMNALKGAMAGLVTARIITLIAFAFVFLYLFRSKSFFSGRAILSPLRIQKAGATPHLNDSGYSAHDSEHRKS
ncbi:MAG: hypothetical protein RMK19_01925 [Bacteroidia bacterium]|nr:hypothetical protein [Bacteroidia bacterium]MDW8014752.1 hypothetical protein [Bacteroidia bacterium]